MVAMPLYMHSVQWSPALLYTLVNPPYPLKPQIRISGYAMTLKNFLKKKTAVDLVFKMSVSGPMF